jgi:hypothetical protein
MGMTFPTGQKQKKKAPLPPASQTSALLDLSAAKRKVAQFKAEIERVKGLANDLVVKDEASAKKAVEIGSHAKRFNKKLEETRKAIIADPGDFVRKVNAFVKSFRDEAEAIERTCKQKHSSYLYKRELEQKEQEKKAQDEARKLQERLDKEAEEKGLEPVKMTVPVVNQSGPTITRTEDGASGSIRKEWKYKKVEDFSKVPDQYKMVNEKAVKAAIKAGVLEIPGLIIEEVPISVFRS